MIQNTSERTVTRVRHTLKFRLLQVLRVHAVTPHLLRVTLGGPDLADFESASFDDHVKVFFPPPGAERPVLPTPARMAPSFRKANRSRSRATSRRAVSTAPPANSIWNSC